MLTARTTVPAPAENPYLVNEIAFFQVVLFLRQMQIYLIIKLKYGDSNEVYFLFDGFATAQQQMQR
jgi:hypothetical protein